MKTDKLIAKICTVCKMPFWTFDPSDETHLSCQVNKPQEDMVLEHE